MVVKVGDIVFLNSGSPPLTVIGWDDGKVHVRWRANASLNYRTYPPECLTSEVRVA